MMNYYSNFPGPTKNDAKAGLKRQLIPIFNNKCKKNGIVVNQNVRNLMNKSVNEGVNAKHQNYSMSGWSVFGLPECKQESMRIFNKKLQEYKKKLVKNAMKSVITSTRRMGSNLPEPVLRTIRNSFKSGLQ